MNLTCLKHSWKNNIRIIIIIINYIFELHLYYMFSPSHINEILYKTKIV